MSKMTSTQYFQEASENNKSLIDGIRDAFTGFFIAKKFTAIEADPLIPKTDKTVLYSNATITPIKGRLISGEKPENGWIVDQPCLRLQNIQDYKNEQFDPEYMSFFHMVGIYVTDIDEKTITSIIDALGVCGLSKDRISVRGCHRDADLLDAFTVLYPHFDRDQCERNEGYFDWKYDMDNYKGRGVHIMIKQDDGNALSIGQLVEITNGDELVGYEFGFGVETFASRLHQTRSIFDMGVGRSFFPASASYKDRQYQDLVVSTMAMHCAGTMPGKNGRSAVLRKAINQLVTHEFLYDTEMSDQSLKLIYGQVSSSAGSGNFEEYLKIIKDQREALSKKIDLFNIYKDERQSLLRRGLITSDYAEKKIQAYANRIGISGKIIQCLSESGNKTDCKIVKKHLSQF